MAAIFCFIIACSFIITHTRSAESVHLNSPSSFAAPPGPPGLPNVWPDGTYTLPKASSGCPSGGKAFSWKEGHIYQDNEDTYNANKSPTPFLLYGFCNINLKLYYCSKTTTRKDIGVKWPKGSYCILKKGRCPKGFSIGYVYWDDENNNNDNNKGGTVPNGIFNRNTQIYYCCRKDAHPNTKIRLPTLKSFFLIRNHQSGCQKVTGMRNRLLLLKTDDEDTKNNNRVGGSYPYGAEGKDHEIGYCHYSRLLRPPIIIDPVISPP